VTVPQVTPPSGPLGFEPLVLMDGTPLPTSRCLASGLAAAEARSTDAWPVAAASPSACAPLDAPLTR
jgi:hypothetical protein